jgi:hypothetical protein
MQIDVDFIFSRVQSQQNIKKEIVFHEGEAAHFIIKSLTRRKSIQLKH